MFLFVYNVINSKFINSKIDKIDEVAKNTRKF